MTQRHDDTQPPVAPPHPKPQHRVKRRKTLAPPPAQLVRVPADFVPNLRQLQRALDRVDVRIDRIIFAVRKPDTARSTATANDDQTGTPVTPPPAWIEHLDAWVRDDGTVDVVIDEKRFSLQPHLGAVFLALAEDTGGTDEGVGWKTTTDLCTRVSKRTGGPAPPRDRLNKYIHKLKRVLAERAGLTEDVIQTNRRLGRRLAVKRDGVRIWQGRTATQG